MGAPSSGSSASLTFALYYCLLLTPLLILSQPAVASVPGYRTAASRPFCSSFFLHSPPFHPTPILSIIATMRFSAAVACLSACLAAPATALAIWGDSAYAFDSNLKVPGENPIEFCSASRDGNLIDIKKVDLAPNPPKA